MMSAKRTPNTSQAISLVDRSRSKDMHEVRHRSRAETTFKGGQKRAVHRWFRLTPSFSPDLVTSILAEFGSADSHVLDPFAGRGTTLIECQLRNTNCVGIEINPFLHFVSRASLNWRVTPDAARLSLKEVLSLTEKLKDTLDDDPLSVASDLEVGYPEIHNVHRWWRHDVLRELLILKGAIKLASCTVNVRELLRLILASILLESANITLGRLQLHFIDRSRDAIDPVLLFIERANVVIQDLETLPQRTRSWARVVQGDSTNLAQIEGLSKLDLGHEFANFNLNFGGYVWPV